MLSIHFRYFFKKLKLHQERRSKVKKLILSVLACIFLIAGNITPAVSKEKTIVFGDLSWDSIQLHHHIIGFLLEKGWGYKAEYSFSETMPGYLGLERGNLDAVLEIWTEAQKDWWTKATESGKVLDLGRTFPNSKSGWYIPRYLTEGDSKRGIKAIAPDLKTPEDLKKYWKIFVNQENPKKGRFYNAPTGWSAHTINTDKIKAYGLEKNFEAFDPGSSTALATVIKGLHDRGKPVIAYYWEPTPLLGQLDMVMLEEPVYNPEAWKTHSCASPSYTVAKGVNAKWLAENEETRGLIERYNITLDEANKTLAWLKDNDNSMEKTVMWFLRENPEKWKAWVADQDRITAIEKAIK